MSKIQDGSHYSKVKQNVLSFATEIEAEFGVYIGFFGRAQYSGVTINHITHRVVGTIQDGQFFYINFDRMEADHLIWIIIYSLQI